MTVRAGREPDAFENIVAVAARTGHRAVGAEEWKCGFLVIETPAEFLEADLR